MCHLPKPFPSSPGGSWSPAADPPRLTLTPSPRAWPAQPPLLGGARAFAASNASDTSVGVLSQESITVTSDGRLRLATFEPQTGVPPTVGVAKDGKIWAIQDCLSPQLAELLPSVEWDNMVHVLQAWDTIKSGLVLEASSSLPLDSVRVLAPLPRPSGPIMCIGKNYAEHVKEVDTWKTAPDITAPSIPEHPIVFTKAPQSVIGTGLPILLPPANVSDKVDYEAELAVVIGKEGKAISEKDAMNYVFGYTILNDVTARDIQKKHQQWFLGKSCDSFCPIGPWLVPASEVEASDLSIKCWVNDELRQNGRTSQLIFPIPTLIATLSKAMTLQPGDILATGTPSGVGSGFNPPKHLKSGDVVRIQIEGLGELVNPVKA